MEKTEKTEISVIDLVNSPDDLKNLKIKDLKLLAGEIRKIIIDVVSENGGHLASNLGVVELSIALHKVFKSPRDRIIWDVGHQCYTHKILTGRKEQFKTIRQPGGLSGFPKRSESIHDPFDTGHASTSISAGLGILTGMNLQGIEGKVVAVIGDGALSGGMAFEALNHAGHIQKELIVVLNDNNMSISPNVGALSIYLSRLTTTLFYQTFRRNFDRMVKKIPLAGNFLYETIVRFKKGVKAVFFKENIFSELGFEYVGPIDGHNISQLVSVFENVRKIGKPVVIHVSTIKGKGYELAEGNPTFYHGVSPFSIVDGKVEKKASITYTEAFASTLMELAAKDSRITAVTAAMAEGTGLRQFMLKYPDRFFDVGITEQHAVTFAAGMAASGLKPVVAIYSTFIQRAVDQIIHDVALQSLPVVIVLDRAGLVENDGETHHGIFDISLFLAVPNIEFLSPYDQGDMTLMLKYAFDCGKPVILRFQKELAPETEGTPAPIVRGRGCFIFKNTADILIMGFGGTLADIVDAGYILSRKGIENDIYNMRFIKPLDEEYLAEILSEYKHIFLFEDNTEINSLGEFIASFIYRNKIKTGFHYQGIGDLFPGHARRKDLIKSSGLNAENIADYIENNRGQHEREIKKN